MIKLSFLAIMLGLGYAALQAYGLVKPAALGRSLLAFARSHAWGVALMLLATAWFLYNLSQESIADFASSKNYLLIFFGAVGVGACYFVRDYLSVRGLAVLMLLLAKLMVDTGRPSLPTTTATILFQAWAYLFVILGIWLTVSPWRFRDWVLWNSANEKRMRIACCLRMALGLAVAILGFTKF